MNSKTSKFLFLFFISISLIGYAADANKKDSKGLKKTLGTPTRTKMNINNVSTFIENDSNSDLSPSGNSGLVFPKGSAKTAVFESGLIWGAKVAGDPQVRVGGNTHRQGMQPGKIISPGLAESVDLPKNRIYRVRPDIYPGGPEVDLSGDAIDEGLSESAIRAQYETDWTEWPVADGAEYFDANGNGKYDPVPNSDPKLRDIPGVKGADQTIWFVCNDLDASKTQNMYGTLPLGIELQGTFWAYAQTGALGNMFFRKYKLINKSNITFDSMYVSMWSDVDLGTANDDYAGCDTLLSLGYVYNANATDDVYSPLPPPAVGFDFFQGPLLSGVAGQDKNKNGVDDAEDYGIFGGKKVGPGKINLPMTAYYYFARGDASVTDPVQSTSGGATSYYNFFQGRIGLTGAPFVDPNTGQQTTYALPGDPQTRSGWVDGQLIPPDDRRIGSSSGPFQMAVGDTQEVVVAQILAGAIEGTDRLSAVGLLKFYDQTAQLAYDNFFDLPTAPPAPQVNVVELDKEIVLSWGDNWSKVDATESSDAKGYKFQGYNVYQLPSTSADVSAGKRIATYDIVDGVGKIVDFYFDAATGVVAKGVRQFGNDTYISRYLVIKNDELLGGTPLINGIRYYYAVTSYSYNPDPLAVPNNLENPLAILTVIPHSKNPGIDHESTGLVSDIDHSGTADATADVLVVDPTKLTGDQYEVYFNQQHYYLDGNGQWNKTNYPDSVGKKLAKDVSPSSLGGVGVYSSNVGTIDLKFTLDLVSPTDSWVDGIKLTFPPGVTINSADVVSAGGGDVTPEINGNIIVYGLVAGDTTQNGVFHGGEVLTVNVNSFTPPLAVDYIIYDDGYPDPTAPMNAVGTTNFTTIGYQFVTQNHWNVKDVTKGLDVLEDQTILFGTDIYAGEFGPGGSTKGTIKDVGENANVIVDGLQFRVNGSYAAPTTIDRETLNGESYPVDHDGTTRPYALGDFTIFGNATGTANEAVGYGTLSIDELQQDYEFRWTGVTGDTVINGQTVVITKSGGSWATLYGARQYSIANHPLNPNPGSTARFLVRIPFEVWNIDKKIQINYEIYDRGQANPAANGFRVWNTTARMYCQLINTPYAIQVVPDGSPNATWNNTWYYSAFTTGDVIGLYYANPLQTGKDKFAYTAPAPSSSIDQAKLDVEKVNVFPNPYYGVNSEEINKYNRFVTFNHLPVKATIRIFNLAGVLVRDIEKNSNDQFQRWDLANNSGLPVASGLYIAYIDMPDLGKTKVLKVAIIQEQQILDRF